jgi:hypothetical protein
MRKEHLTPDGWKPCNAIFKKCKYERRNISDKASAFIDSAVKDIQKGKPDAKKNLFDKFFGPVKKSSSKLDSIKEVPVEIGPTNINKFSLEEYDENDDDEGLDTVIQGENGQYEIDCRAVAWGDAVKTHKFGDFIKDKATAEMLHQADPHKRCQLGWCSLLAEGLLSNEHVAGYYIFKTEKEPVIGEHHFVKLKDGTYADSLGIWTEEALFSTWKANHPTAELSSLDPQSPDYKKLKVDIKVDITEQDIFPVITELIDKHMNGETL